MLSSLPTPSPTHRPSLETSVYPWHLAPTHLSCPRRETQQCQHQDDTGGLLGDVNVIRTPRRSPDTFGTHQSKLSSYSRAHQPSTFVSFKEAVVFSPVTSVWLFCCICLYNLLTAPLLLPREKGSSSHKRTEIYTTDNPASLSCAA